VNEAISNSDTREDPKRCGVQSGPCPVQPFGVGFITASANGGNPVGGQCNVTNGGSVIAICTVPSCFHRRMFEVSFLRQT